MNKGKNNGSGGAGLVLKLQEGFRGAVKVNLDGKSGGVKVAVAPRKEMDLRKLNQGAKVVVPKKEKKKENMVVAEVIKKEKKEVIKNKGNMVVVAEVIKKEKKEVIKKKGNTVVAAYQEVIMKKKNIVVAVGK